jgi:hypothetical protein
VEPLLPPGAGASRVQLGPEAVWLPDADLARFRAARPA